MTDDAFPSAAGRHASDARLLHNQGRYDSAAYLAGYAVECTLKSILEVFGHAARQYGHDLKALQLHALILAVRLSPGGRRYRVTQSAVDTTERGWEPGLRYTASGTVSPFRAEALVEAAEQAYKQAVIPMILDGAVA